MILGYFFLSRKQYELVHIFKPRDKEIDAKKVIIVISSSLSPNI